MAVYKQLIIIFVIWRIFLCLPFIFGEHILSFRQNSHYVHLFNFTKPYEPVTSVLLYPWANFDGVHYLSIAALGYASDGSNARFLPVYPLLIKSLSLGYGQAFGGLHFLIALIISHVSFLLSLIFIYKLVRIDFSDQVAIKTVLSFLVFPTSFYFVSIYSESLFLFLTILTFYYVRKKLFLHAGISALLLTATRIVGIALIPALYIEYAKTKMLKNLIPLVLAPLGIALYALYNLRFYGEPLFFISAHTEIVNSRTLSVVLPPQTIFRYLKILTSGFGYFEWWIALLELGVFFLSVGLLYYAWKKKVYASYIWYGVVAFLIPVMSGTFSGLPRYVLVLFPIFIALAFLPKKIWIIYCIASLVLLFILCIFFSKGYYIA